MQLAGCIVLHGATKAELLEQFYGSDAGRALVVTLKSNDIEAEFRMVFEAALDHVVADMRSNQAKAGLN